MRNAAKLARQLLDRIAHPNVARPGVTTEELDTQLHNWTMDAGAYPSPLNYSGFPKSVCTSVNEVVCHGIPDSRPLVDGDVLSLDVSVYLNGVHGDNCATIIVGDVDTTNNKEKEEKERVGGDDGAMSRHPSRRTTFTSTKEEVRFVTARRLVQAALESREEGIKACGRPNACLSDIGTAVHAVADAYGYNTVRQYRGHGISTDFHCAPFVKHFRNSDVMELLPGMIFTIEPMITENSAECDEWSDEWTVVTRDGGRAAQFEHTVLITEMGVEILTLP